MLLNENTQRILTDWGVKVPSLRQGNQKVTCPACSHSRKDKRDRCLSVKIDYTGVQAFCHHCGFRKGEWFDDSPNTSNGSQIGKFPSKPRRNWACIPLQRREV
jgi:hypothetical protein